MRKCLCVCVCACLFSLCGMVSFRYFRKEHSSHSMKRNEMNINKDRSVWNRQWYVKTVSARNFLSVRVSMLFSQNNERWRTGAKFFFLRFYLLTVVVLVQMMTDKRLNRSKCVQFHHQQFTKNKISLFFFCCFLAGRK